MLSGLRRHIATQVTLLTFHRPLNRQRPCRHWRLWAYTRRTRIPILSDFHGCQPVCIYKTQPRNEQHLATIDRSSRSSSSIPLFNNAHRSRYIQHYSSVYRAISGRDAPETPDNCSSETIQAARPTIHRRPEPVRRCAQKASRSP